VEEALTVSCIVRSRDVVGNDAFGGEGVDGAHEAGVAKVWERIMRCVFRRFVSVTERSIAKGGLLHLSWTRGRRRLVV
jgi:hypothetical protein